MTHDAKNITSKSNSFLQIPLQASSFPRRQTWVLRWQLLLRWWCWRTPHTRLGTVTDLTGAGAGLAGPGAGLAGPLSWPALENPDGVGLGQAGRGEVSRSLSPNVFIVLHGAAILSPVPAELGPAPAAGADSSRMCSNLALASAIAVPSAQSSCSSHQTWSPGSCNPLLTE